MTVPFSSLGDYVEILSGFAFESKHFNNERRGMPLIRIRNVLSGASDTFYEGGFDSRFLIRPGEIVIGMDGEFNRARWGGVPSLLNQRVCRIRSVSPDLDEQYLFHYLPRALKAIEDRTPFATVKHLSSRDIASISISLPPLCEQRRIAAALDQAEDLRRKRRLALEKLNTLPQAVFRKMFGDPGAEHGCFPSKSLAELTTKIGSGSTPTGGNSSYKPEGVSLIRSMNVRDGYFSYGGLAFLDDQQAAKLDVVIVQDNDVLVNITGASVARVCKAPSSVLPARVNQHVSIIRPNEELTADFLEAFLLSPTIKRRLLRIAQSGATRQAITKSALESLQIPVPPASMQCEFSLRIADLLQLKARATESSSEIEALCASLQHHAFSGQLRRSHPATALAV